MANMTERNNNSELLVPFLPLSPRQKCFSWACCSKPLQTLTMLLTSCCGNHWQPDVEEFVQVPTLYMHVIVMSCCSFGYVFTEEIINLNWKCSVVFAFIFNHVIIQRKSDGIYAGKLVKHVASHNFLNVVYLWKSMKWVWTWIDVDVD